MPKIKLTQLAVDKVKPPTTRRIEYFDTQLPGFALRVTPQGHKSWTCFARMSGRLRRFTFRFALYPRVDDARERARELLRMIDRGEDPRAIKVAAMTVEQLIQRFIAEYSRPKNKSWELVEATLRRHLLPRWSKCAVDDIKRADVRQVLEAVAKVSPIGSNRLLSMLRRMFGWSVEHDLIEVSPVVGVRPLTAEVSRDRVLSDAELVTVWRAAEQCGIGGSFIKMLMLTAQRRDEVVNMRWADIEAGVWTLRAEATKGGRSHQVPLSAGALDILDAMPHRGAYVFSARGHRPLSNYSKLKKQLEAQFDQDIGDWRFHDLRRSAATGLASLGVDVQTIGRVLGHSERGVTAQVYVRHSYLESKRQALHLWSQHIHTTLSPVVVNLHAAD
jgi:integrase